MRAQLKAPRTGAAFNPAWPFTVPLVGLPIWWLLGIWQLMFFAMAVPMAVYLLKQRRILMPRGFGIWLLWILWLLTGLLVMQVDAPGTVSGVNTNRYLSFGFRFGWYLVATIAVLYVVNTRRVLSSDKIMQALAWFFVALVGGGVLGLVAPGIDFPSALQAVLPDSIASNPFVNELTRVQTAQIQDLLGEPSARPSAPFIYTNEWGFATAISMPFFVAAWWVRGRAWRIAMSFVLAVAAFTIIASLNRGVWIAILAGVALAIVQAALQGRLKAIAVAGVIAVGASALILFSPLGDMVLGRLANPRSDDVRGDLAGTAVETTAQGSPLLGFGTTRYVLGTFSSIAGGATDACPSCEPPPLGTHGQLWLVIFGAGFIGAALYVGFIASQFLRHVRATSAYSMAAATGLLLLLVTLPLYNAVGIPLYIGLIGIGILARESPRPLPSLQESIRPFIRRSPVLLLCVLLGGLAGMGYNLVAGVPVVATQRVLVPASELVPVPGVRTSTLDSEAVLAGSSRVVGAVADTLGVPFDEAQRGLRISAEPNTRVLLITYEATTQAQAQLGAETAVGVFLDERAALLEDAAADVAERYRSLQEQLDVIYGETRPIALEAQRGHLWDTLGEITRQRNEIADVLAQLNEAEEARAISGAVIVQAESTTTVRVASGMALGLLVGLALIWIYDRKFLRIGDRPSRRAEIGVPVIAGYSGDGTATIQTIEAYAPIAGVIADAASARARDLAARLERSLELDDHAGARTIVVVDSRSRADDLRRLIHEIESAGLNPVGLVLCGNPPLALPWWLESSKERAR
ncbi:MULTISPECIES: hypothetical protein [Bacteria]